MSNSEADDPEYVNDVNTSGDMKVDDGEGDNKL